MLIGNFGMPGSADRTEKNRDDAITARIAGNHAGTTVNNHDADARRGV